MFFLNNVLHQVFEHYRLNSIHHYCIGVAAEISETENLESRQIKPILPAGLGQLQSVCFFAKFFTLYELSGALHQ